MNLESFGWPPYSGPFFNFCKGFVTSLKMYSLVESKEMCTKSL